VIISTGLSFFQAVVAHFPPRKFLPLAATKNLKLRAKNFARVLLIKTAAINNASTAGS